MNSGKRLELRIVDEEESPKRQRGEPSTIIAGEKLRLKKLGVRLLAIPAYKRARPGIYLKEINLNAYYLCLKDVEVFLRYALGLCELLPSHDWLGFDATAQTTKPRRTLLIQEGSVICRVSRQKIISADDFQLSLESQRAAVTPIAGRVLGSL